MFVALPLEAQVAFVKSRCWGGGNLSSDLERYGCSYGPGLQRSQFDNRSYFNANPYLRDVNKENGMYFEYVDGLKSATRADIKRVCKDIIKERLKAQEA